VKSSKFVNILKFIIELFGRIFRSIFTKIGNTIDKYNDLSETEKELMNFGLDAFEYFDSIQDIPDELEPTFHKLKRKISKLSKS
jgi:hypothetical protein